MRLLDRYLLRELLVPFGYCLSGFWIFWVSCDLFAELGDFQRLQLTFADLLEYYAVKTPELLVVVLPIAFLLALLYALTNHARHHELTAMRAAGLSLWRLSLPYLGVGLVLSLALFALNELWVPRSVEETERILASHTTNAVKQAGQKWERKLGFINTRQNRKWFIEAYNPETYEMIRPHVEWVLATGTRTEITAERAYFAEGHWVFTNVSERIFPAIRGEFPIYTETNLMVMTAFMETPAQIQSEIKVSRIRNFREVRKAQLTIREILNYKRLHRDDTSKDAMLDTKLHGRLATPWTCLVVVLIALPFGAVSGRRDVFVGVASSIMICFSYFVLGQLTLALGVSGQVPPWVAAWSPNVLFSATGIGLMNLERVRGIRLFPKARHSSPDDSSAAGVEGGTIRGGSGNPEAGQSPRP